MAYGYYQQSGMPGWGTNQVISVNRASPSCLTFSFSFSLELHLLRVFSLNPPVSLDLLRIVNVSCLIVIMQGEALISIVLMLRPPIRQC